MSRYLLDTNIISAAVRPNPPDSLSRWFSERHDEELYVSSLTIAELQRGILQMPAGRKRAGLEAWFAGPTGPRNLFAGRILSFDEEAALIWARLMADGVARGRPRSGLDTIIAAVAEANACVFVTENARDFPGLDILNPLRNPS
ncbi:type II toxin-antitoxin system VapC family toxin [Salinarimonas sp. NSM]|uniref:type II toxin-antitoxin system VapC family toxin n=1 Tax=Salinarimonas sp. NSM TaxID=3458003 RepID=UPI0040369CBD